jgi:hypothetical protein
MRGEASGEFVWFLSCIAFQDQMNQTNERNQIDQIPLRSASGTNSVLGFGESLDGLRGDGCRLRW